ncbi:hypothetical protein DH2020_021585 [Rehmannia glutinosa]|uniref:Uncharacterized protein n=1 Tax=Rehmannia glutinosa TaxID=99300 RepID=A0ABR0WF63_REHGL
MEQRSKSKVNIKKGYPLYLNGSDHPACASLLDCMLIIWILNSLSKIYYMFSLYERNAKELWDDDIAERFGGCNGPLHYQLKWDMKDKLIQFLMGLNESHEHVRSQILIMDPLPKINKAYSMLLTIEKQRNAQLEVSGLVEISAMMSKVPGPVKDTPNRFGNNFGPPNRNRVFNRMTKEEKGQTYL